MKVWVTRDNDSTNDCAVVADSDRPKLMAGCWYDYDGCESIEFESEKEFKEAFGFTPRKGSIKQMELSLTEIA